MGADILCGVDDLQGEVVEGARIEHIGALGMVVIGTMRVMNVCVSR